MSNIRVVITPVVFICPLTESVKVIRLLISLLMHLSPKFGQQITSYLVEENSDSTTNNKH